MFLDFFKKFFHWSNIPTLFYLALNVGLITFFVAGSTYESIGYVILLGLLIYGVSLLLGISPLGEWYLRLQTNCKKIYSPDDIRRLEPIFNEVYARAKTLDPNLAPNVRLFISEDPNINAFATGTHTVCLTRGILALSDDQIKGALAHELGHLSHRDTVFCHLVITDNFFLNTVYLIITWTIRLLTFVFCFFLSLIFHGGLAVLIVRKIGDIFLTVINVIYNLWIKFGFFLQMFSARRHEFAADAFAFNIGYGNHIISMLSALPSDGVRSLTEVMFSSHPATADRLAKLHAMLSSETRYISR